MDAPPRAAQGPGARGERAAPGAAVIQAVVAIALLAACLAAQAQTWRGNFVAGKHGLQMSPCRSGERLAVADRTPERDLEAVYREIAQRPGRAIFVELQGRLEAKTLMAERLVRASAEGPGCREDLERVRLRAQGSDPLWQLEAREDGVFIRTRGGATPMRFASGTWSVKDTGWSLEASTGKSVLHVTVRAERCRDPLLGLTTLRALADLDGRKLLGCAWQGDAK